MTRNSLQRTSPAPEEDLTLLTAGLPEDDRRSLRRIFRNSNWKLQQVLNCREAREFAAACRIPVVICGPDLPDGDWKTLLESLAALPNPPNLIVLSRLADDHFWAEVLNLGGYDVLLTPFEGSEVLRVVFLAWQSWKHA